MIEEKDRLVQEYYHNLMSQTRQGKGGVHPIVLMVDTAPTSGKVDIKGLNSSYENLFKYIFLVYTPLTIEIGRRQIEATMPLWLQTEICYSDADRTILDELRKCASSSSRKMELQSGIEPLKSAVDDITGKLAVVQDYVQV